jgi:hypothetical protein
VLSDRDKRVLEELERQFPADAREPVRSRAARRRAALVLLGCVLVGLVVVGVPVAAFALALAVALGWGFWWLWSGRGHLAPRSLPGESVRRYLRWLAEAE